MPLHRSCDSPPARPRLAAIPRPASLLHQCPGRSHPRSRRVSSSHRNPVRQVHHRRTAVRDCRTPQSTTVRWGRPAGPTSTIRIQTSAGGTAWPATKPPPPLIHLNRIGTPERRLVRRDKDKPSLREIAASKEDATSGSSATWESIVSQLAGRRSGRQVKRRNRAAGSR